MKHLFLFISLLQLMFVENAFAQNTKPNIIIFISDDQNQMDVGCYGNREVATPHMDRLASEGMRFNRAYAASSMCTPSRSNMFTGLYPFRNGSQMNHFAVQPSIKSLPHYLQPLGYRVALAGKSHILPQSSFPFEYISSEMGKYQPIECRSDPKGETVRFIQEHFAKQSEQPLCLIVATWWPHVPWMPNRDFDPKKLTVPGYLVDTKETRQALAAYFQSITEADKLLGNILEAVEDTGEKDNTVFMFFSDQGAQFPSAKWTTYDMGLKVPFLVRWPGKVQAGSISEAMISLTDLTPTLIDLAGGDVVEGLDGESFTEVLLGEKDMHRPYIFAETSVEPHYWYNYVPARTIITDDGYHYIKNYVPGARFITHIDRVERNMFYFDSWIEQAKEDEQARFLLHRYSYRPSEELYNLKADAQEFHNLAKEPEQAQLLTKLRVMLSNELIEQGETDPMILQGQLPIFYDQSYEIKQGTSAHPLSFDKSLWNPDTLFVTAYIEGLDQDGILCNYFNQFRLSVKEKKIGLTLGNDQLFFSNPLTENNGHIVFRLTAVGDFELTFEGETLFQGHVPEDFTKIGNGYVSCGFERGKEGVAEEPPYFNGTIHNLRFTMNKLNQKP